MQCDRLCTCRGHISKANYSGSEFPTSGKDIGANSLQKRMFSLFSIKMSAVDLYFFEELTRVAGHDVGLRWMQNVSRHASKQRKSSSGHRNSLIDVTSRHPATSTSEANTHLCNEKSAHSASNSADLSPRKFFAIDPKLHLDSLPAIQPVDCWPSEMFSAANASQKFNIATRSVDDPSLGLIFTDAAHTILDK
jgi:hypothetical protein